MKRRIPPRASIMLAIICFVVAAIPASGLVLRSDPVGRLIFAAVWILVGLGWLGGYLYAKKPGAN